MGHYRRSLVSDAWEAYQRGMWHSYRFTAADNTEAQTLFRRAIAGDGTFAPGHAGLAYALYLSVMLGFSGEVEAAMAEAVASAERAVALDGEDALGQATLGRVKLMMGAHGAALSAFEKALALNPNYASAHYGLAMTLVYSGRPEESLAVVERATRLSPRDPLLWGFLIVKGQAHLSLNRLAEALTWMREAARQPNAGIRARMFEAVALAALDRIEEARQALQRVTAAKPDFDMAFVRAATKMMCAPVAERYMEGLRKAGQAG